MPRRKEKERRTTESVKSRQGSLTEVSQEKREGEQSSSPEKWQAGSSKDDSSEAGHLRQRLELGTASRHKVRGRWEQIGVVRGRSYPGSGGRREAAPDYSPRARPPRTPRRTGDTPPGVFKPPRRDALGTWKG